MTVDDGTSAKAQPLAVKRPAVKRQVDLAPRRAS
jgi:hypothetical protein